MLRKVQRDINCLFYDQCDPDQLAKLEGSPSDDGKQMVRKSKLWSPSTDIRETQDKIILEAEVPGMKKEEISIELSPDNVLTLSGQHKFEEKNERDKFHRVERRFGSFRRSLRLPSNVDTSKISAKCEDGVLAVEIPKTAAEASKRITIS